MDKDEILQRGRVSGPDEREQKIYLDSLRISGVIICALCIVFIILSIIRHENFYPYCIMAMAYCCAEDIYRFAKIGKKRNLIFGIISGTALICWIILFIIYEF